MAKKGNTSVQGTLSQKSRKSPYDKMENQRRVESTAFHVKGRSKANQTGSRRDKAEEEKLIVRATESPKNQELTQKLSVLRDQKNRLDAEAGEWAEKRDELNEQIKTLRAEILELKGERDKLNEKVKELKQQREETKTEIREKIEELRKLNQEVKAFSKKKPSRSFQTLQKEVEGIEWKIQTTPLSLQEEKELVERVKQLETQLNILRKLDQLNQKILELRAELKALETNSKLYHEKLIEAAQESQEIHKRMLEKIGEAKKLKIEADNLHKLFLQTKEKARPIQEEMSAISNQIRQLREEIREEDEREKKKREEALREELERQAREKLKRGEKLTWQEFQLLAEKGTAAQN